MIYDAKCKVHFLFSHVHKFPDNLGAISDEQRDGILQDLMAVEERYQGKWDRQILAEYYWSRLLNVTVRE